MKNKRDWICNYCGKKGYRIDKCWKKHGVPDEDRKRWNAGANVAAASPSDVDYKVASCPQMQKIVTQTPSFVAPFHLTNHQIE